MAEKKAFKAPPTLDGKVRKWLRLRQILARAQDEKEELQPYIEKALEAAPEKKREFGPVTLSLTEVQAKRFNEKRAKEELGEAALAPFYDEKSYTRINVK
jgi:hypothetical protein